MDWDADFAGLPPIELPDGRKLETLAECAGYILALPKRQQQEARWQQVTAAVAEGRGTRRRVAVLRASGLLQGTAQRVGRWSAYRRPRQERSVEGEARSEETAMTTVWIYVNTSHGDGHPEHVKVFATGEAADAWFAEHDPEGGVRVSRDRERGRQLRRVTSDGEAVPSSPGSIGPGALS